MRNAFRILTQGQSGQRDSGSTSKLLPGDRHLHTLASYNDGLVRYTNHFKFLLTAYSERLAQVHLEFELLKRIQLLGTGSLQLPFGFKPIHRQAMAFSTLAQAARRSAEPALWAAAVDELGAAAGSKGMAGGQWLDIEAEGRSLDLAALETLHTAKTGALLTACVRIGALLARADADTLERLSAYGRAIGLAFQVVDDILDVEGSLDDLGKVPGVDADRGKPTYPALLGLEEARATAQRLRRVAVDSIAPLGAPARPLAVLANCIIDRSQ